MTKSTVYDIAPSKQQFLDDVLIGLRHPDKSLSCKYFYDERGSHLFERICELDEYYLTRTEIGILEEHASQMAERIGENCLLVEYGSGSSVKTEILLDQLKTPAAYFPVDISRDLLENVANGLALKFPWLSLVPVCADFTDVFELPEFDYDYDYERIVAYFPGSTIGNFAPTEAVDLLSNIADLVGEGGGLLIGVDLKKDRATLERAYNDNDGVTAEFNLNLLERIKNELDAEIEIEAFRHEAVYNEREGRIEIYIVSERSQSIWIDDEEILFDEGERIHTENSHKYSLDGFASLARQAGFEVADVWTDPNDLFSVQYLTVNSAVG